MGGQSKKDSGTSGSSAIEKELEDFINESRPETTPEFDEAFDAAARLVEIKHEKAVLESTKVSTEFRITELRRLESERREIEGAPGLNDERQEIEDRKTRAIKKTKEAGDDPFKPIEGWELLTDITKRSRSHLEELCPKILGRKIRKKDEADPQSMAWLYQYEVNQLINPKPIKRARKK